MSLTAVTYQSTQQTSLPYRMASGPEPSNNSQTVRNVCYVRQTVTNRQLFAPSGEQTVCYVSQTVLYQFNRLPNKNMFAQTFQLLA